MASTYLKNRDPALGAEASDFMAQSVTMALVSPNDTPNSMARYAKSLRVYVASGPAVVRVTPLRAVNDTDTVDITFPTGLWVEPCAVRQVWSTGTTGSPVIHAYQ